MTAVFASRGEIACSDAAGYLAAQIAGGILGVLFAQMVGAALAAFVSGWLATRRTGA